MPKRFLHTLAVATVALSFAGCSSLQKNASAPAAIHSAYTVQTAGGASIARVITAADSCPVIDIDGQQAMMTLRASPATVPARDASKKDSKPAAFPLRSCEAPLPRATVSAHVGGQALPLAPAAHKRIVILGDTGCRMKQSDREFQACNDAKAWPFAEIVRSAAALKPDLVIHVGDFHYRESPCPPGDAGCAGSPWGFGFDAWDADFFAPAAPLLKAAPWVFMRGNHESCARAGQGWFRFLDTAPWSAARSCDDPANDGDADYSAPYGVPLNATTQLIVFDSSRAGLKAYKPDDAAYKKYLPQLEEVDRLAALTAHNFFLAHHPVLGFAPNPRGATYPGNPGLQSMMALRHPQRLYPRNVDLAMHGHVHLFEALSFASDHPATLVLGNSGSAADSDLPSPLPAGLMPAPGAIIDDFVSYSGYGFASLELVDQAWQLKEFDVQGRAVFSCALKDGKSRCTRVAQKQ
jgi:hypothetical protein